MVVNRQNVIELLTRPWNTQNLVKLTAETDLSSVVTDSCKPSSGSSVGIGGGGVGGSNVGKKTNSRVDSGTLDLEGSPLDGLSPKSPPPHPTTRGMGVYFVHLFVDFHQ